MDPTPPAARPFIAPAPPGPGPGPAEAAEGVSGGDAALVALVEDARRGDRRAFEVLVTRYQGPIVGYLTGMLGSREDARDAAQEVFVRTYTHAHLLDPGSSFRAWLYRIATNVAIDALRRRRRMRWLRVGPLEADGDEPAIEPRAAGPGALQEVLDRERSEVLRRAIATLPIKYRSALVLRDLEDFSYEEIAAALRCRTGTVKSRINRARNLLRDKLAAYVGEGEA